jgi:peroxiredoxin
MARIGKPAPDFHLKSVDGKEIHLSQFRGKQAVVLVFIYGDT